MPHATVMHGGRGEWNRLTLPVWLLYLIGMSVLWRPRQDRTTGQDTGPNSFVLREDGPAPSEDQ